MGDALLAYADVLDLLSARECYAILRLLVKLRLLKRY